MPIARPFVLTVLAWLFIISGTLSIVDLIVQLTHGRLNLNVGVLLLPIGIGLLRRSRIAFYAARFALVIQIILLLIFCGLAVYSGSFKVQIGDLVITGWAGMVVGSCFIAAIGAGIAWEIWVLRRPDVKEYFQGPRN